MTLHHSHRLAGRFPSTSPPPLGDRNRQSGHTTSHFDSHTMGDNEDEILEMSSPPHKVGEEDPTPVYDPSADIPSNSGYDPSFTGRRYWLPGDETHYEPTGTSHVHYGMSDISAHDPAHHVESEIETSTTPGGTPIPFHAKRFGSTSHIVPSILVVEATSHVHPRPSVSSHMRILELRRVTRGNTTYIPSHVPSSSNPTPSNAFFTTLPPPHSRGPSGGILLLAMFVLRLLAW